MNRATALDAGLREPQFYQGVFSPPSSDVSWLHRTLSGLVFLSDNSKLVPLLCYPPQPLPHHCPAPKSSLWLRKGGALTWSSLHMRGPEHSPWKCSTRTPATCASWCREGKRAGRVRCGCVCVQWLLVSLCVVYLLSKHLRLTECPSDSSDHVRPWRKCRRWSSLFALWGPIPQDHFVLWPRMILGKTAHLTQVGFQLNTPIVPPSHPKCAKYF